MKKLLKLLEEEKDIERQEKQLDKDLAKLKRKYEKVQFEQKKYKQKKEK